MWRRRDTRYSQMKGLEGARATGQRWRCSKGAVVRQHLAGWGALRDSSGTKVMQLAMQRHDRAAVQVGVCQHLAGWGAAATTEQGDWWCKGDRAVVEV